MTVCTKEQGIVVVTPGENSKGRSFCPLLVPVPKIIFPNKVGLTALALALPFQTGAHERCLWYHGHGIQPPDGSR